MKIVQHKVWRYLTEISIFLLIVGGLYYWQHKDLLANQNLAPNFVLSELSTGKPTPIYREGNKTLVYFFAPWCSICRLSMGNLNSLDSEVNAVAVALSYSNQKEVENFIHDLEINVPVLIGSTDVAHAFNIDMFPTYYLIDENGKIDGSSVGYSSELGMKLRL